MDETASGTGRASSASPGTMPPTTYINDVAPINTAKAPIAEATEVVKNTVIDAKERAGQLYNRTNAQVIRKVDPIPIIAFSATLGFVAGYFCAMDRR